MPESGSGGLIPPPNIAAMAAAILSWPGGGKFGGGRPNGGGRPRGGMDGREEGGIEGAAEGRERGGGVK